jgi:hypothetical protein
VISESKRMDSESLRVLRAKHTRRLMESGDTVNALLDHIDWLTAKLLREENEHAELQSRCFEGFPSVSDGIFDAYRETKAELLALRALVLASRPALEQCAKDSESRAASFLFGNKASQYGAYLESCAAQLRTLSAYGVGK